MDASDNDRALLMRMIRDSAAAIAPRGDLSRVRRLRGVDPGFDRGVWGDMGDLGWIGLRVSEDRGGLGLA